MGNFFKIILFSLLSMMQKFKYLPKLSYFIKFRDSSKIRFYNWIRNDKNQLFKERNAETDKTVKILISI